MSYDYASYQTYMASLMATSTSDQYFTTILPMMIDYAEQRIYRELDLLSTRMRDSSTSCTAGSRLVNLTDTLVVCETLSVITPATATEPSAGQRVPLTPCTHDFIDTVYPNDGPAIYQATPRYFAMLDQQSALVGPSPDANYVLEVVGTFRPVPLSADNTTTPLSVLLPDLFVAASAVFAALYQRNFAAAGAVSGDTPLMAGNWEAEYAKLFAAAQSEEARKKFQSASWTPMINTPQATKQRG